MTEMNISTKETDSQTERINLWLPGGRMGERDVWGVWD